ncbi:hypothetical protein CEXT_656581 [Caerostris extrusa]|uniref:Uncharacterized protein n=1 Tax=Caerostris extrusa TaxID=172846 RepID=A0AAV4X3U3_CAEEX|nr:hypothetical protein CEXT_656581 [Caerostris extrusa]
MEIYINWVKRFAIRPVKSVELNGCPSQLHVEFQDGRVVTRRLDVGLRLFFILMQNINGRLIDSSDTLDAIPTLLGYFELLGYQSGDVAVFMRENDIHFTSQFS